MASVVPTKAASDQAKPHENGAIVERYDGFPRSWHVAFNKHDALYQYVDLLARLRAQRLDEPVVVKLVQMGRVVEQTRVSGERD
jgi:hypothetical protein